MSGSRYVRWFSQIGYGKEAAGLTEPVRCWIRDGYGTLVAEHGAQLGHRRGPAHRDFCRPARTDAVRLRNASRFTDRAISYRIDQGFDHFQVAPSACVMKMVRADLGASGMMFSFGTEARLPPPCHAAPSPGPAAGFLIHINAAASAGF